MTYSVEIVIINFVKNIRYYDFEYDLLLFMCEANQTT